MIRSLVVLALAACQSSDRAPKPPPAAASGSGSGSGSGSVVQPAPVARPMPPPLPDPLPGARKDITALAGTATRVAILDRQVVFADATQLRLVDTSGKLIASAPVDAGVHVLATADVDGDGHAELYTGTGISREHKDAKARVTVYRVDHDKLVGETVLEPVTSRAEIVAIVPMVDEHALLLAYFDSKYTVTSVVARRTAVGWQTTPVAQIRMATSYARGDLDGDGKPELVVGRLYGDAKGVDGDAFVLAPDGKRTPIATTRGVRSLAIADGDLFVGDGWHQNYAAQGRGLLTQVRHARDGFHTKLVEDTIGQYTIEHILPAMIDRKSAIVAVGSHYVRIYTYAGTTWKALTIAGAATDVAVGDLDGLTGDELVIIGPRSSEVVNLTGVL